METNTKPNFPEGCLTMTQATLSKPKKQLKQQANSKQTITKLLFFCGCSVDIKNITEEKNNNKYKCSIHNSPIQMVFKKCKFCNNIIPYTNIQQILQRDFCSKYCITNYKASKKKILEDNPPPRLFDCISYSECLCRSFKDDNYDLGCSSCKNYQKDNDFLIR